MDRSTAIVWQSGISCPSHSNAQSRKRFDSVAPFCDTLPIGGKVGRITPDTLQRNAEPPGEAHQGAMRMIGRKWVAARDNFRDPQQVPQKLQKLLRHLKENPG